ncbi:subtilisin-like protease SBT5.4 isoform X2 [Humulus lupulus]|uniref:subtilisin-like protease SBT5.4 isoform X2 n=1 Tax=Humulus lupulus TaxID=3486 RepID=UPI002B416F47|nr:subtilisin-like protease SBT5.4 isoform X2 [Humulus lupulus]
MTLHCTTLVSSSSSLLSIILIYFLLQSPVEATKKPYIVYLGTHSHGVNPSSVDLDRATNSHYTLLGSYLGSEEKAKESIFYSYNKHINGFAAILDDAEAAEIRKHPDVVSVFLSKGRKLHTTRSWEFLRLEKAGGDVPYQSLWNKARFGEDIIIANLDTGIWPESKSFSEYEGIGPIPSKWRGNCQSVIKDKIQCNRKLIGAKYFNKGFIAHLKALNASSIPPSIRNLNKFTSRDTQGHGTHTLSTAGGSFIPGANILGNGNGTAKGGSPKARVAAYKICWPPLNGDACFDADVLAAFDAAISDGVDVISASFGGPPNEFFNDTTSIGSFHATMNNIAVVASAGNDGPDPQTVSNVSPWLLTVAASTIDREFNSYITLGNKKQLKGASLSSSRLPSHQKFYPLIRGLKANIAKVNPIFALDPKKVKGKILICFYGDEVTPPAKSHQASLAGAVGVIVVNDISINDIDPDTHFLPASNLNSTEGRFVYEYLNTTKNPTAYITPAQTKLEVRPSPLMASFSSRGPNSIEPALLKPDITAPGVNILAAFTEAVAPSYLSYDKRRVPFNTMSGTSMSCPHVAGITGLLKALHPDWSPAMIHSAIMTTARVQDNNKGPMLDWNMKKATPFEYGSGHIQPNRAMDPGLVYDRTTDDNLNFLCAHGYDETLLKKFSRKQYKCPTSFSLANFNYPSIVVTSLSSSQPMIVTRKVKNVGPPGTYRAYVRAPAGVSIFVKPASLKFSKIGEEKKFEIILKPKVAGKPKNYVFGQLKWSDGKRYVRSPIVVKY